MRRLRNILVAVLAVAPAAFSQVNCNISITGSFPSGTTGQPYSATLTATTTFSSPVSDEVNTTWFNSGLPAGLSLSPTTTTTTLLRQTSYTVSTTISGTPTMGGTFPLTVQIASTINIPCQGGQASFSITIANVLAITTQSPLPGTEVGLAYSTSFTAVNAAGAVSWSITGVPAGLNLSAGGVLSGTPSAAGTFQPLVTVTDARGNVASKAFSLTVAPSLAITTLSPLSPGVTGTAYQQAILTTGGFPPYSFVLTGTSPPGLTLSASGVLSGTPTSVGTFPFTVQVTDSQGFGVSQPFQVTITPVAPLLQVSPTKLSFSALTGGSAAPPQLLTILATGVVSVNFSIAIDGGSAGTAAPSWLSVNPLTGTAPRGVTVIADPGKMGVGTYPATLHVTVPQNTFQSSIDVPVVFTISAGTPTLAASPAALSFAALVQTPSTQDQIVVVSNSGGGGSFSFSASVVGQSTWVSVSPATALTGPDSPALVRVQINSQGLGVGNFHDILQIATPYGVIDIPITLFVSPDGSIIGLPINGVRFLARQGNGTNRPQVVDVLNLGDLSSSLNPTVNILSGSDWLNVATTGSAARSLVAGVLTLTAGGDTTSLPVGAKYALVQISDPNALNSPAYLVAVLDVEPAATSALPDPAPAGVFFTPTTAAQNVLVYTSSAISNSFQASASTSDGTAWLSVSPGSGISSTQNAGSVSVQVNATGLAAGVYTGNVNISMGGAMRSVNVTLAVPPPPSSTPFAKAASTCTPISLAITQTGIVDNFSAVAGWPASLIVQLNDNCANPISNGSVAATFSNGDPSLTLHGDGATNIYAATWEPGTALSSMAVTLTAANGTLPAATEQLVGGVNPNAAPPPSLVPGGTLHIFFDVPTAAALGNGLAPGNVAQVYGTGLAATPAATCAVQPALCSPGVVPLLTEFSGTFMLVGPIQAPLFYVSSTQIDVQIPVELTPNRQYYAVVTANGVPSPPEMITLVPFQPGMASFAGGTGVPQVVAQHAVDYSLVTAASPAKPGEPLIIYLAGLGATNPQVPSGTPTPSELVPAVVQPTITLNGEIAAIAYAGLSPSGIGLYQINFTVPSDAQSGNLTLVVTQPGTPSMVANTTSLPVSH